MQLVTDTHTPGEDRSDVEHQMLLAMRALDHEIQVQTATLQQVRKEFTDRLKDATHELHERIRQPVPTSGCKAILVEIQELDQAKQRIESEKSAKIESLKQKIASAESAFFEILRQHKNPKQVNLNFSGAPDGFDPHAGILLGEDHVDVVRRAADSYVEAAGEDVDGMDELRHRLDDLGVAGLGFPADGFEDDGEDDDDEDGK